MSELILNPPQGALLSIVPGENGSLQVVGPAMANPIMAYGLLEVARFTIHEACKAKAMGGQIVPIQNVPPIRIVGY